MVNNPGDSVRIVLFDKDDSKRVMVLDEADDIGNFKLPGGKFDSPNEAPEDAAKREQSEEIVSYEEDTSVQMAGELVNDDGVSKRYIFFRFADPNMIKGSEDINSIRWVTEPPEGKNQDHMQTAISLARQVLDR